MVASNRNCGSMHINSSRKGKPPSNTAVSSKSPVARKQEVYSASHGGRRGNSREELKILGLDRVMTQVKQSCGLLHQSTRLRQLYQRVQF